MKRVISNIVGAIFVIGCLIGGFFLWRRGSEEGKGKTAHAEKGAETLKAKPVAITVDKATARPIQRIVRVVGSLYGQEELTITPKVEGKITKIWVDLGDRVKPGDLLLEIDETDYRLAVTEAERALELELAKLGLKELPATKDKFDLNQLPNVVKAAFLEKNSQTRKERLSRLGGGFVSSQEERDQAETDNRVAKANYQQALLEAMTTLAAAEHRKAILDTARQKLKDTKVLTPFPEMAPHGNKTVEYGVTQRMASLGELLKSSPGTTMQVFKLVIDDPLKLQATVPERHLSEIKVGQTVQLEVESYRNEIFKGRVVRVNPMVDRNNRTFQIEVEIPNDDKRLHAGSFAKASILTQVDPQALTIPEDALINFAGVTKVFVVRDGLSIDVPVTSGVRLVVKERGKEAAWVEVRGNLKLGEEVVTSGQSRLSDRREVRLRLPEEGEKTLTPHSKELSAKESAAGATKSGAEEKAAKSSNEASAKPSEPASGQVSPE